MASNTPRLDGLERNLYINGNMDFWQRGTSISKSQGAYLYTADRLKVGGGGGGSGAYTISRSTDVPTLANRLGYTSTVAGAPGCFSGTFLFAAADVVRAHGDGSANNASGMFRIVQVAKT